MEDEIEKRGPGRPRRDETEIRSALRTADVRATPVRERKRKGGQINDRYYVDPSTIPTGMSYEWKRATVYGAEDPSYNVMMREQGWEPVASDRHPELVTDGYKGPIMRDGLILMERPAELTREAQEEDRRNAFDVVQTKRQQLGDAPAGTFSRTAAVKSSFDPMPIDG